MGITLRKSVIVVGAGASKEFNLPTGQELTKKIAEICDIRLDEYGQRLACGDPDIYRTLINLCRANNDQTHNINHMLQAGWKIRDNMPLAPSIDNFMDTHREDNHIVLFGKLAIVHAIQKAENQSLLGIEHNAFPRTLDYKKLDKTWLHKLFKILVAQRDFENFLEALRHITFVSFNYDRCILQFFCHAAESYFTLVEKDDIERILSSLNIIFPYGSIGEFFNGSDTDGTFGKILYGTELLELTKKIRTFTEGTETDLQQKIWDAMSAADMVIFLGFGFLPLNMKLLFGSNTFPAVRVLGTGKGLSTDSILVVTEKLRKTFFYNDELDGDKPSRVRIDDFTCSELFYNYDGYLTQDIPA